MNGAATTTRLAAARDHIIDRPRLTSLLTESGARIMLLAAPAGYGKTTLARQWSALQTGPVAWYRTTHASGDVAALAVGIDTVLANAVSPEGRDPDRVAAIASANARPSPLGRALVSIYGRVGPEALLVVDEYETAGTAEADELMKLLVEGLDIRLLVTSRERPSWLRGRRAVYGEVFEIGVDDLTMTDDEALEVLSANRDEAAPLLETARGWPAVLGLAARSPARGLAASTLPARPLYDFIAGELLDSAPAGVADGLTLLATASVVDVAAAEIVLGERAGEILGEAHRIGLVRLEEDRSLSLHPLLRDLLLARVRDEDVPRSGLIASFLPLVDAGRWDEALAAAERIPDPDFVSLALERALPTLLRSGRATTLRRWVAAGREARASQGLVDYAEAELALRDADFARAIALGESAAESLEDDLKARAHLVAGRASNLEERGERAAAHFRKAEAASRSPETLSDALWGKFLQAVDDEDDAAEEVLKDFEARSPCDPRRSVRLMTGRIHLAVLDGWFGAAVDMAEPVVELLDSSPDPLASSSFLNSYSCSLSLAGRYQDSLALADLELAISTEYELEFVRRHATLNRARALIGLRQIAKAERCLVSLDGVTGEGDVFLATNQLMERARLQITVGDLEKANAHLFFEPNPRLSAPGRGEYLALRGLVLAGRGHVDEARAEAKAAATLSRSVVTQTLAAVATAMADLGSSDPRRGARVDDVFEEVARAGGLDAIVLACRASSAFAGRLAACPAHRASLAALLQRSQDVALARHVGLIIPRAARKAARLSPRESEVHELIAQGRTNREIASALYISESTTKLHVRHIFEKLGVRSRVEAVRAWPPNEEDDGS
jgi:LuxR family maltose regulon positive regulatory protein